MRLLGLVSEKVLRFLAQPALVELEVGVRYHNSQRCGVLGDSYFFLWSI
jgi:hypothetical protein